MVDRGERAEPSGQAAGLDRDRSVPRRTGGSVTARWPRRFSAGNSAMNACSSPADSGLGLDLARSAGREHATRVHHHQPVECSASSIYAVAINTLISGRRRTRCGRSAPRTDGGKADRRRSSARPGSRVLDRGSGAAQPELLLHPAGEFSGRSIGEGDSPVAARSSRMRRARSVADWPKSRPKKSTFSKTDSVGRGSCPGPAACTRSWDRPPPGAAVGHVPAEHAGATGLDSLDSGDQGQERRFAGTVGTDEAGRCPGRDLQVNSRDRNDRAVAVVHAARLTTGAEPLTSCSPAAAGGEHEGWPATRQRIQPDIDHPGDADLHHRLVLRSSSARCGP